MGLNADLTLKTKYIYIYFLPIINPLLSVKLILSFLSLGSESFAIQHAAAFQPN